MSKVGVVILNYKDSYTTISLCKKIESFNNIDRIIVVDNMSPDDSFKILLSLENEKINVIQSDKNGGYSYGNNFGAYYLIDKYNIDILIVANPDVEFTESFIYDCLKAMKKFNLACVSGVMLDASYSVCKMARKINSFLQDCIECTVILKKFLNVESIDINEKINFVELVPGSLFAVDAKVFKEINGFDDRVFLYCEERILGTKLKRRGYKSAVINSTYVHRHSVTINKSISKLNQLRQIYKSRKFYYDNYTNINIFKKKFLEVCMFYGFNIRRFIYSIYH